MIKNVIVMTAQMKRGVPHRPHELAAYLASLTAPPLDCVCQAVGCAMVNETALMAVMNAAVPVSVT